MISTENQTMHICRSLHLLCVLSILLIFPPLALLLFSSLAPLQAQRADPLTDQVREAASLAVTKADPGAGSKPFKIQRRQDLEDLLSTFEERKAVRNVYFYQVQSPSRTVFDGSSVWIVAAARSPRNVYQFYSFDGSGEANGTSQEFNRLVSQLALSISEEKLTSFAKFFLESYITGESGDIVLDEEGLRHAVERYYFATYGDVWRAIDAYSQWWQAFQEKAPDLRPRIGLDENGRYRVGLKKLLTSDGQHPQVQAWELEISRQGNVRVVSMQTIFPKQPRWLFYDVPGQQDWHPR